MNIDRLTEIAEWLEAGAPEKKGVIRFNMGEWIEDVPHHCGTACCIAGAVVQFSRKKPFSSQAEYYMSAEDACEDEARTLLGLKDKQAKELFYADAVVNGWIDREEITAAWAARCVRKLIATGEVDWLGTKQPQ